MTSGFLTLKPYFVGWDERKGIYIFIADSCCYTAETNTTL